MSNHHENDHHDQPPRGNPSANGHGAAGGFGAPHAHHAPAQAGSGLAQAHPALALPQGAANSAVGVAELWLVLRRWGWKCTVLGSVLSVTACTVVWLMFVPKYESSAW